MGKFEGVRILVIGINYYPENAGIGPYTTETCRMLASEGAQVAVFTGLPHYPAWKLSQGHGDVDPSRRMIGGVAVLRLKHHIPDRQTVTERARYEWSFAWRVLQARLNWKPQIIVAVTPALLSAGAAAIRALLTRAPLVIVVQDLMGLGAFQSGIQNGRRVSRILGLLESHILRRARAVIVVSDAMKDHLSRQRIPVNRIRVIRNWTHVAPPSRDRNDVREALAWSPDRIVAMHCGNMGLKQDLENIVHAARIARDRGLLVDFILAGDGSQRRYLQRVSAGIPNIRFLDPIPDSHFTDTLAAADVLIVNERPTVKEMSIPSKLTSYIVSGRPIVAAVHDHGATAQELRRLGVGVLVPPADPGKLLSGVLEVGRKGPSAGATKDGLGPYSPEYALNRISEVLLGVLQ